LSAMHHDCERSLRTAHLLIYDCRCGRCKGMGGEIQSAQECVRERVHSVWGQDFHAGTISRHAGSEESIETFPYSGVAVFRSQLYMLELVKFLVLLPQFLPQDITVLAPLLQDLLGS